MCYPYLIDWHVYCVMLLYTDISDTRFFIDWKDAYYKWKVENYQSRTNNNSKLEIYRNYKEKVSTLQRLVRSIYVNTTYIVITVSRMQTVN